MEVPQQQDEEHSKIVGLMRHVFGEDITLEDSEGNRLPLPPAESTLEAETPAE